MSTTVLPPTKSSAPHRRPLRLSTDPEKRSVQIGLLGTILVHILVFLALWHWRGAPLQFVSSTPPKQFDINLTSDSFEQPAPKPPPDRFVETNPDAPENEPDKTRNFAARNQQVAQEKPTPDGKSDRPALEGK